MRRAGAVRTRIKPGRAWYCSGILPALVLAVLALAAFPSFPPAKAISDGMTRIEVEFGDWGRASFDIPSRGAYCILEPIETFDSTHDPALDGLIVCVTGSSEPGADTEFSLAEVDQEGLFGSEPVLGPDAGGPSTGSEEALAALEREPAYRPLQPAPALLYQLSFTTPDGSLQRSELWRAFGKFEASREGRVSLRKGILDESGRILDISPIELASGRTSLLAILDYEALNGRYSAIRIAYLAVAALLLLGLNLGIVLLVRNRRRLARGREAPGIPGAPGG